MNDVESGPHPDPGAEDDLARWREQWRAEAAPPRLDLAKLRRRAKSRTLGLLAYLVVGALVSGVGSAALFWVAARSGRALDFVVAAGLTVLILWALLFELRSLQGLWRPTSETPAAFLDLAIGRCHRWLKVVRASWGLMALETALFVPWLFARIEDRQAASGDVLFAFGFLALMVGLVAGGMLAVRRWALRRLEHLTALRQSLEEP